MGLPGYSLWQAGNLPGPSLAGMPCSVHRMHAPAHWHAPQRCTMTQCKDKSLTMILGMPQLSTKPAPSKRAPASTRRHWPRSISKARAVPSVEAVSTREPSASRAGQEQAGSGVVSVVRQLAEG